MGKITYLDKVTLNENTDISDINKVKSDDMNEIKNVVNGNDDEFNQLKDKITQDNIYKIQEYDTGKVWVDGKKIYGIVIEAGSITWANDTQQINFANSIDLDTIIDYRWKGFLDINQRWYVTWDGFGNITIDSNHIYLRGIGSVTFVKNNFILEYTKTTDTATQIANDNSIS